MFVIPKKDLSVVDPQRMDTVPPEGRDVGDDHADYWERRRMDGDVQFAPPDQIEAARKQAAQAEAARNEATRKAAEAAEAVQAQVQAQPQGVKPAEKSK